MLQGEHSFEFEELGKRAPASICYTNEGLFWCHLPSDPICVSTKFVFRHSEKSQEMNGIKMSCFLFYLLILLPIMHVFVSCIHFFYTYKKCPVTDVISHGLEKMWCVRKEIDVPVTCARVFCLVNNITLSMQLVKFQVGCRFITGWSHNLW